MPPAPQTSRVCFCLARDASPLPPQPSPELAALRSELEGSKTSALRQRATLTSGIGPTQLAEVDDAPDSRSALLALLLAAAIPTVRDSPLRSELEGMKTSALRVRALAAGAEEALVCDADDSDDTKAALIELVLGVELAAGGAEPAAGAEAAPATIPEATPPLSDRAPPSDDKGLRSELSALRLGQLPAAPAPTKPSKTERSRRPSTPTIRSPPSSTSSWRYRTQAVPPNGLSWKA